jgi:hypothetical protein
MALRLQKQPMVRVVGGDSAYGGDLDSNAHDSNNPAHDSNNPLEQDYRRYWSYGCDI